MCLKMFQKKLIEINNPINPGFYESVLDPRYILEDNQYNDDNDLGGLIENAGLELETNYQEYMDLTSQEVNNFFIKKVNEAAYNIMDIKNLLTKKESDLIISPREYNFTTDRVFFKVNVTGVNYTRFINKMFNEYRKELNEMIIKNHSSYDGFHSFYSNDITDWETRKHSLDYNELSTVFETLLNIYDSGEDYIYDLAEIASDTMCQVDQWYEGDGAKYDYWQLEAISNMEV